MGKIAVLQNNYEKAVPLYEEAFKIAHENNFFEQKYEIMKELKDVYNYVGEYKKSLDLFYEFHKIKDSLFTTERDKNLNDALQKYEAAKKDEEIVKQKLEIELQNRLKNRWIIGGIGLGLFAMLITLFFRKRIKYQNTITLQNRALQQKEIEELQQKNRLDSMSSMIAGQETERLRIAKDLHDSLGGLLSTVKAHFSSLKSISSEIEKSQLYGKTNSLIDEACVEVRRISHNMMPHSLSLMGLKDALVDLSERLQRDKINTTVEIEEIPSTLDETQKVMIYRLMQELISNIQKHAQAKNVLIQSFSHKNIMTIIVEDDGIGFDVATPKDGLGLESMRSRVAFLNGTIHIDAQPHKGTSVNIEIPLS